MVQTITRHRADVANLAKLALVILTLVGPFWPRLIRANAQTVVSIFVDNEKRVVSTDAPTVGEALERAHIIVGPEDLVEPGLDTAFSSSLFNVNIYRAKPVVVVDGDREIAVNTPYQNPKLIAERSAGLKVYDEDQYQTELIKDFVGGEGPGMRLTIIRAVPIDVSLGGAHIAMRTQAKTVGAFLTEKGIDLEDNDKISVPKSTAIKPNLDIEITRIGYEVVARTEALHYPTETVFDSTKPVGYEQVRQEGIDGKQLVTYQVRLGDGEELSRRVLQTEVLKAAKAEIVVRGSKPVGASDEILAALRQCESGGNYHANTGNGFYGAYQFTISTWNSMGTSYSRADLAPPAVQDDATRRLQLRAGWGQWPACAASLGLY